MATNALDACLLQNRTFGATRFSTNVQHVVNYNLYSSFMLQYNTSKLADDGDDNSLFTQQQQRRLEDTYQPLDEIQLTRDFRASLILTQLGQLDPVSSCSTSSSQVPNEVVKSHSVQQNTTPPLSPSSSTSEVRGGGSSSSRSNSEIVAGAPSVPVSTTTIGSPTQQPAHTMKGVN